MLTIEDLSDPNQIVSIGTTVSSYKFPKNDPIKAFINSELYFYAKFKGSEAEIPIAFLPIGIVVSEKIIWDVKVNGQTYYQSIVRESSKDKTVIKIGKSMSLISKDSETLNQIKFEMAPMLRDRMKDNDFFIAVIENGYFSVGDVTLKYNPSDEEKNQYDIEKMRTYLHLGQRIVVALDVLNIEKDINLNTLTEQELVEFVNLVVAFVDDKPIHNVNKDLPTIGRVTIQDIHILLIIQPYDLENGLYNLKDFFTPNLTFEYTLVEGGEKFITSHFSVMQKEDYIYSDNINYNIILPSYKFNLQHNPRIFEPANMDLLKMISAYDESGGKNEELLKLMQDFSEWIFEEDNEMVMPYDAKLLNKLQVILREREFNKDEISDLMKIIENQESREDCKVAAYLLLGKQAAAEIHFDKMTTEEQDAFKQLPIFKFWNSDKDD